MLSLGNTSDVINQLWATGLKYTYSHVYDCNLNNNNNGRARLKSPGSVWGAQIPVLTNRKYLPVMDKRGTFSRPRRCNRARPMHEWPCTIGSPQPIQSALFVHDWQVFPVCKNWDRGAPDRPRRFQSCVANDNRSMTDVVSSSAGCSWTTICISSRPQAVIANDLKLKIHFVSGHFDL